MGRLSGREKKREQYLDTHMSMMIYVGLSRPIGLRLTIDTLFILRLIILSVIYVLLIIGCCAHIKIVNEYDLLASSINILQLVIYFMALLHVGYFELRQKAVHGLILRIRKAFRSFSNTGHCAMHETVNIVKRRSIVWTVLCTLATTGWCFLAFARGEDPVPVWAPVNLHESPYHEINIVLQFTGQLALGSIAGCFGSFYFSVLSLIVHQFHLLSSSLEHVAPLAALNTQKRICDANYEAKDGTTASKDFTLSTSSHEIKNLSHCECCTEEFKRFFKLFEKRRFENSLTPLEKFIYEEELDLILFDCIVHHQNIVELKNVIDDFLGPVMFVRFILSTLMLCFIIYSLSKLTETEHFRLTDMTFISLAEYYFVGVVELFGYCYIAENLTLRSTAIRNDIFEKLPWHGGGVTKKFISSLKIFHMNATNPTCLRTPFYIVSLNILIVMLRTSFSFYTLLRRLQNE